MIDAVVSACEKRLGRTCSHEEMEIIDNISNRVSVEYAGRTNTQLVNIATACVIVEVGKRQEDVDRRIAIVDNRSVKTIQEIDDVMLQALLHVIVY